ncbi:MAG: response regulator [Gemmobacter sp.]|nr:response regulator [Gemmobacter sp.]
MTTDRPRILVVEDEFLVAMDIESMLEDQGWDVLGPVSDVRRALALLATETPDAACLDMNLKGETSSAIAEVLRQRKIPFALVTGYSERNVTDPAFQGAPLVSKPFASDDLVRTIKRMLPMPE